MADEPVDAEAIAALRKKRQFKKFQFRGIELDKLLGEYRIYTYF